MNKTGISGDTEVTQSAEYAVSFSSGIRRIRHINRFLQVAGVLSPAQALLRQSKIKYVVVWGRKATSRRALQFAVRRNLPVLYVEDGWIRSCSANPHSRVCYSLLIDDIGVYYDATTPSSLEKFLNQTDEIFNKACSQEQLKYALACRRRMVEKNVTKYNYCKLPDTSDLQSDGKPLVLVIDQTMDDASVRYGGMDAERFITMLEKAIDENPHSRVVVRTHPDVVAGKRKGYLQSRALSLGVETSAVGDNPLPWLKQAETVYVGTSQLGYEALLCGCKVRVFGKPFYSGWGLTEDEQTVERRKQKRCLDQMFYATHVHHARYCCPMTGKLWSLSDCLDHVELQLQYFERNAGNYVCVGITPWKKRYLAQFLRSPYSRIRHSRVDNASHDERTVVWSFSDLGSDDGEGDKGSSPIERHVDDCFKTVRVEDGFVRSRGLGSDFTPPASLVFDNEGLYFDASGASALETMLSSHVFQEQELARSRRLIEEILSSKMTKYNVSVNGQGSAMLTKQNSGRKVILVVGQVEGDQSILRGSLDIKTNSELLVAVRLSNPDAYIVYKPHPDVVSGNRKGHVEQSILESNVNHVECKQNFLDCLSECEELHTLTSLSGFEAILRGKTVITYGMPFYAGWGLTTDLYSCVRRSRKLTVDELVYIALIKYPHYVDLKSGEFCSIETIVENISAEKTDVDRLSWIRWLCKLRNVIYALSYRA